MSYGLLVCSQNKLTLNQWHTLGGKGVRRPPLILVRTKIFCLKKMEKQWVLTEKIPLPLPISGTVSTTALNRLRGTESGVSFLSDVASRLHTMRR